MVCNAISAADDESSTNSGLFSANGMAAAAVFILVMFLIFAVALGPTFGTSEPSASSTENESTSTDNPDESTPADSQDSSTDGSDSLESDSSNSYSYDSDDSDSSSYYSDDYSDDSDSSIFVDDEDTLGVELNDGSTVYQDGGGNYYYVNPDGSIEVTDGWGNVGIDTDLDGEFDSYSTDGGETWRDWD